MRKQLIIRCSVKVDVAACLRTLRGRIPSAHKFENWSRAKASACSGLTCQSLGDVDTRHGLTDLADWNGRICAHLALRAGHPGHAVATGGRIPLARPKQDRCP